MKNRTPKIKKFRFIPVYSKTTEPRKTRLGFTRNKSGIYIIKEQSGYYKQTPAQRRSNKGSIVYVGKSGTQLYKTILRHFQTWTDSEQKRIVYNKAKVKKNRYTIKVIFAPASKINTLENQYINYYLPRDNKNKIELLLFPKEVEFFERTLTAKAESIPEREEEAPF